MIADEVRVLTPALLGGKPVAASVAPDTKLDGELQCADASTAAEAAEAVVVKAWADRDGSIVVVAANTANADGPTTNVAFAVNAPSPDGARRLLRTRSSSPLSSSSSLQSYGAFC